jgi:hypothetical protein
MASRAVDINESNVIHIYEKEQLVYDYKPIALFAIYMVMPCQASIMHFISIMLFNFIIFINT